MLNNSPTYRGYVFEEQAITEVVRGSEVQHVDENASSLNIFPNPAKDKVYIEVVDSGKLDGKIRMFDASGKQVGDYTLNFVAGGLEADIRNLRQGLCFVTLTDPNSGFIQTGKLVKN